MNVSTSASPLPVPLLSLARVLKFDALTCVAMGLLLVLAYAPLAAPLGLPSMLLLGAGVLLFPCALLMWLASGDPQRRPALVWAVILGNAGWVVASALVAFVLYAPTALGLAFVLAQAVVVALIMVLEFRGLARRQG